MTKRDGRRIKKSKLTRDQLAAIMLAKDEGKHYRDVADRFGISGKYVLNIWAGRRQWLRTGLPENQEPRPRVERKRLGDGRKGIGLTDEELGELFHETDDHRVRWLVLHAIQLRGVIRDHVGTSRDQIE